jgi:predicted AAA+ superfamily ATPase
LVLREDVRDLESIRNISALSLLLDLLSSRVGGLIVASHLAQDLQVAPKTIIHWIEILERMFLIFPVRPYSKVLARAIRKSPKIYFYDNAEVESQTDGSRIENLVATHLFKKLHFLEDSTGDRYELNYVRDKEKHEVDFLILKNRKPSCLIEVKKSDPNPHTALNYFGDRLQISSRIQLVAEIDKQWKKGGIQILKLQNCLAQPLEKIWW